MNSRRAIPLVFWAAALTLTIRLWPGHHIPPNAPQPTAVPAVQSPCLTYPHSLVACGVRSMDDVDAARANDPTLSEHYADLGILRPVILRADEMEYASFRQGARIVWTAQPVRVAAGELVLEDRAGNRLRGRCGNRLSPIPRTPKAFVMPPEMEHETPTVTLPEAPYLPSPPLEQVTFPLPPVVAIEQPPPANRPMGGFPFIPPIPIIPISGPASPVPASFAPLPSRTPAVAVGSLIAPEPGTVWLAVLALGGLALRFGQSARISNPYRAATVKGR